jgi:DnaJ-class molecular chaperone
MDHYSTLGVDRNASPEDIKRAYRKLASQHHPDKGGDKAKFQDIQAAYDTLSNPDKKSQYDNPMPQGFHHQGNMPHGFEDVFAHMFGNGNPFGDVFGRRPQPQPVRNRTLNLQTQISLEDAFHGKDMIATIQLPSGRDQILEIKIPAGVADGTTLRLAGMGDDSIGNMPRGDIHLSVHVMPHHEYQRQGDDLVKSLKINCIDAMLGKTVQFTTIDNRTLEINIVPGTQHGQTLAVQGYGMPNMSNSYMKGRLLLNINITIPTSISEDQKHLLRQINL